jgi:hypothetical protein
MANPKQSEEPTTSLSEMFFRRYAPLAINRYGSDADVRRLMVLLEGFIPVEEFFRRRGKPVSKQRLHQLTKQGRIETLFYFNHRWVKPVTDWLPKRGGRPRRGLVNLH